MGGRDGCVRQKDVLEFVVAGRQDRGTLVDLGGVEQIEHREMLDGEDAIHTFKTQAPLAIQKVRDVGLFETGLLRQTEAGQIAFLDALPEGIAEVVLQDSEFHSREYSMGCIAMR